MSMKIAAHGSCAARYEEMVGQLRSLFLENVWQVRDGIRPTATEGILRIDIYARQSGLEPGGDGDGERQPVLVLWRTIKINNNISVRHLALPSGGSMQPSHHRYKVAAARSFH